jgi:hypothetical protein
MSDTIYTATFTLVQEGLTGPVTPKLEFNPKVDPTVEDHPAIYEYMSHLALTFIRQAQIIDENGEITDDESFQQLELDLSINPDVETKH